MRSCRGKEKQGFMATLHIRAATDGAKTTLDMAALGKKQVKKKYHRNS
jgi:hypothetical protein